MNERYDLRLGDSRDVLRTLSDCSVDSVVCDPPYDLQSINKRFATVGQNDKTWSKSGPHQRTAGGFMNQKWDTGETAFDPAFWTEVLRVLKPGGHLLAFGGTRTYHKLATAIEAAGFEVRDMFATALAADDKVAQFMESLDEMQLRAFIRCADESDLGGMLHWTFGSGFPKSHDAGEGRGTALKPAHEPICMARKPLIGTVAENVLAHGTGAINVDACRVETDCRPGRTNSESKSGLTGTGNAVTYGSFNVRGSVAVEDTTLGRWPANLIHDGSDEVLSVFPDSDGQCGDLNDTGRARPTTTCFGDMAPPLPHAARNDSGSAARFFYCAKASKQDREEGCEHLPAPPTGKRKNGHPTVKPTDLMAYLCRLVTPHGGLVLDPFMGSGSTGKACMLEGFRFIGIEREANYMEIARARVAFGAMRALSRAQPGVRDRKVKPVAPPSADLFAGLA